MFDPAIIEAMNHALAFRPPAIVQEVVDIRARSAEFLTSAQKQIAAAERLIDAWIRDGVRIRDDCRKLLEAGGVGPEHLQALGAVIEAVDRRVAEDGRSYERLKKAFRKQFREAEAISREAATVVREVGSASLRLLASEARERAEFGLFLRALRADHDPGARGGPVFDDPDELRRYLEAAAA